MVNSKVVQYRGVNELIYGTSDILPYVMITEFVKRIVYFATQPPNFACLARMYRIFIDADSWVDVCLGPYPRFNIRSPQPGICGEYVDGTYLGDCWRSDTYDERAFLVDIYGSYTLPDGTCGWGEPDEDGLCGMPPFPANFPEPWWTPARLENPVYLQKDIVYSSDGGCRDCPSSPFVDFANYKSPPGLSRPCVPVDVAPSTYGISYGFGAYFPALMPDGTPIDLTNVKFYQKIVGFAPQEAVYWPEYEEFLKWYNATDADHPDPGWRQVTNGDTPEVYEFFLSGSNIPPSRTATICPYLLSNFPGYPNDDRYTRSAQEQQMFNLGPEGRRKLLASKKTNNDDDQTSPGSK